MGYLCVTPIFVCQLSSDASKLMSTHFRNAPFYTLMKGNCDKARTNMNVLKYFFFNHVKAKPTASASPADLLKMQTLSF